MKLTFTPTNAESQAPASLQIILPNGCTITQHVHPQTNEPVTEGNYEAVAQACVSPDQWVSYQKLKGVLFEGVMCSAASEDMWGLNSVHTNYQLAGQAFQPTRFEFANGNALVLTKDNIAQFMAVWVPFRQSFFAPPLNFQQT